MNTTTTSTNLDFELEKLESVEIRPAYNGYIITVRTGDSENEHVFDSHQKTLRFIKKIISTA